MAGPASTAIVGSWTVGKSATSSQPSESSTWIGLGGGGGEGNPNNWGLIQDGVSLQTNEGYRSWWEYLGSTGCAGTLCDPHYTAIDAAGPGDFVTAQVWWSTTTEACFYFSDQTHSSASFFTCQASLPIPYDHTSAEWMNETHWPDFYYDNPGTINWSGQKMTDSLGGGGTYISPFSGTFEGVIMAPLGDSPTIPCSGSSDALAYPVKAVNTANGGSSQIISCSIPGIDSP